MKRFALLAFAFTWLAACDRAPSAPTPTMASPSFDVIANQRFTFATTAFNPCPPAELVAISGEVHFVVQQTGPDAFKVLSNWDNVKGVGLLTGASYTAEQNVKNEFEFTPLQQEVQQHFRLIREGNLDNFDFFLVFTFPPFQIVRSRMECRG